MENGNDEPQREGRKREMDRYKSDGFNTRQLFLFFLRSSHLFLMREDRKGNDVDDLKRKKICFAEGDMN